MEIIKIEQVGPNSFVCNMCKRTFRLKNFSSISRDKLPNMKLFCHSCNDLKREFSEVLGIYNTYEPFHKLKHKKIRAILMTRKVKKDIDKYFKNKIYT